MTVVVDKLIGFLNAATDNFMRIDLLSRISQLSEKYAPSNDWFVTAMNRTMELAGEQCKPEYANMVMKLIIDNASGQAGEEDIREFAVDTYLHLLATRKTLPDLLVQVSAWVIGEYGHTSRQSDAIGQLHALIAAMDRAGPDQAITKGWIISAMLKIVARHGTVPSEVLDIVTRYQNSQQVDLQQRAHEFIELAKAPQLMRDALPADQASVDIDVDDSLTFLESYVNAALSAGAKAYQPRSEFGLTERKDDGGLKITAYAAAPTAQHTVHGGHGQQQAAANPYANQDPNAASFFGAGAGPHNGVAATSASGLPVKERKWGPTGFNDPHKAAQEAHPPQGGSPYGGGAAAAAGNFPSQQQSFGGPHEQHGQHGQHGQPDYGQPHQPVQGSFGRPQRGPPQVSEKEKLASSLFAGVAPSTGSAIGGGSRPTGSFGRPTGPSAGAPGQPRTGGAHQPGASHVTQPPQQQPQKQVDLLGGMFADGSGQAAAKPPSQNDLVGLFGAGQQPPGAAGGPSAAPRSSGGPLDLLASSPPPAGGAAPGGFDLLGGGGDSGAPASPTASAYGLSSASPAIQAQLAPLPKSSPLDVVAGSDARLQVSYIKAYGREATTIGVFLSNKTQQPVPNITLSLSIPPGLSGNFTGEPTPQARPGASPGTHNVVYATLAPSQTASLLINLSVRELTFLASSTLSVSGQVQVPAGGAPLSFSVPLELGDMVRPAEGMTTAQYGGFWKQYTDEAKGIIRPSSVTQPPEYMQRVGSIVRLFPVQTIGQECIAAGKLVSPATQVGAANLAVFVHGKVAGGGVDVIVRSKSAQLSQALVKQLQAALK